MHRQDAVDRYRSCVENIFMNDIGNSKHAVNIRIREAVEEVLLVDSRPHAFGEDDATMLTRKLHGRDDGGNVF